MNYDAANRRTSVTLPNGVTGSYTFDGANELTAISYDQGTTHVGDLAYGYDQAARRIAQSGSLAALGLPSSIGSATYDAGNHLVNWGGTGLSYDNNGNLTSNGSSSYTWNARDQLTATSDGSGSFSYDAFGRRVAASTSGAGATYTYDAGNPAVTAGNFMLDGLGLDEVYADVSSGATPNHLIDALGSTVALTDSTGTIAANYSYSPYGATAQSGTSSTPFQFTGREDDGATNLYYYRARYYSPVLNRFISEDPIRIQGGMNFYAYVGGSPTNYNDPYGLYCLSERAINGIAGAAGGAFSGGIALAEAGPIGIFAGILIGGATGGAFGYYGATNSWNALAVGAATGVGTGLNTPGGSLVGGTVGGAVSWELQSNGAPEVVSGPVGGAAGGFAAAFVSSYFSSNAPSSVGAALSQAIRAGGPGALTGLSGAAVSVGIAAALRAGNDCGCGGGK